MQTFLLILLSAFCFQFSTFSQQPALVNPPAVTQSAPPASIIMVTGQTLGTSYNQFTGSLGFQFVPTSNITITDLGRWVISGNSLTHVVGIYNSSCVLLGSVTVNCSGATPSQYLYGHLTSGVSLVAGQTYSIQTTELSGGDVFYLDSTTITTTGDVGTLSSIFSPCTVHAAGAFSYGPVNAQYTKP